MADRVYRRLAQSTVSAAELVHELRRKWGPDHGVGEVHRFVEEVANSLLRHDDVEVGEIHDGRFVPSSLEPWDAHFKLAEDLMSMDVFLEDETRYVFRRTRQT